MRSVFQQQTVLEGHELPSEFNGGKHVQLADAPVKDLVLSADESRYAYVDREGALTIGDVSVTAGIEIEGQEYTHDVLSAVSFNFERGFGLLPSRVEIVDHERYTQAGFYIDRSGPSRPLLTGTTKTPAAIAEE